MLVVEIDATHTFIRIHRKSNKNKWRTQAISLRYDIFVVITICCVHGIQSVWTDKWGYRHQRAAGTSMPIKHSISAMN